MALTPHEAFERMQRGEDVDATVSGGSAIFAKAVLRRQAGYLAAESCVEGITFTPENMNPWAVSITFTGGELSEDAQRTLAKMRSNSHQSVMTEDAKGGLTVITFYLYIKDNEKG